MTIDVVAFIIGGILIGTAIVGGGFEVKEIKMPRVGAGVRIVSLIVGSGFLLLGMGIWGANNPHLLAEQVPASSMMPTGDTASAVRTTENTETQTRSTQVSQPAQEQPVQEQPVQEFQDWTPDPVEPVFTGFVSENQLVWNWEGTTLKGTARFNGTTGFFRVAFVHPETWAQVYVDQDLVLRESNGFWWYMGTHPRDASTGRALAQSEYDTDNFRVVSDGQGGWTIDQVCGSTACVPVAVQ